MANGTHFIFLLLLSGIFKNTLYKIWNLWYNHV